MQKDVPSGQRFTQVYLSRDEPAEDSPRMRHRLASLVERTKSLDGFVGYLEGELGVRLPYTGVYLDWDKFFVKSSLSDVLDTVTLAWRYLSNKSRTDQYSLAGRDASLWPREVNRILREENVRYAVDGSGGVHFSIDQEFEHNSAATVAVLNSARYRNVLNEFDAAHASLGAILANAKGAVRAMFSAAECLFRLMFSDAPRLGAKEIDRYLVPLLQRTSTDPTSLRATLKLVGSLKEWVDAAHFFRHEQGEEDIAQPSLPLSLSLVSIGASYIRWLAEIDSSLIVRETAQGS